MFPLHFIEFRMQVDGPVSRALLEPADHRGYFGHGQALQEWDMQCILQVASASLNNRSLKDHQKLGYRKRIEAGLAWPGVLIPA